MKTPKRKKPCGEFSPRYYTWEGPNDDAWRAQRWKRKNKLAQYKRTIARLEKEKEEAYHKGHKAGYDLGFARMMF